MKRHYFISDSLDTLEAVEQELEARGITEQHIHVLSDSHADLETHNLQPVSDFMKTDVVHSGLWGLGIGLLSAGSVILITALMGWASVIGWTPFVFLAVVVLGFCTWEGGFLGFQEKNRRLKRFEGTLHNNCHVLLVDITTEQGELLEEVIAKRPQLAPA
jgi:hypothetical protein